MDIFEKLESGAAVDMYAPEYRLVLAAFERIQQTMFDKDLDTLYASVTSRTFTQIQGGTQT